MKCKICNRELGHGDTYIEDCYNKAICKDCYTKTPYTAYVYKDRYGDFVGISQDINEQTIYVLEEESDERR